MRWAVPATCAVLLGCAGNGEGLDQNGRPVGSEGGGSTPLTADLQSIQDNVFTPICSRCHIGANAPEGLQLDAAHSYSLLVGVPSVEDSSLLRVKPGDPDNSYMIRKIQGGPGIVGGQMPLGLAPLPQSTIDVIRTWVANGAAQSTAAPQAMEQVRPTFEVAVTAPPDRASLSEVPRIVVSFTREVDANLVNYTTVVLEQVSGAEVLTPVGMPLPVKLAIAAGNPATVLITPVTPLAPGTYRVTLRGTGGGALADLSAVTLGADYSFAFTVEGTP
jgi:hypothetical protein